MADEYAISFVDVDAITADLTDACAAAAAAAAEAAALFFKKQLTEISLSCARVRPINAIVKTRSV